MNDIDRLEGDVRDLTRKVDDLQTELNERGEALKKMQETMDDMNEAIIRSVCSLVVKSAVNFPFSLLNTCWCASRPIVRTDVSGSSTVVQCSCCGRGVRGEVITGDKLFALIAEWNELAERAPDNFDKADAKNHQAWFGVSIPRAKGRSAP